MDASKLVVRPVPWAINARAIEAVKYCGERGGYGGTCMVRLRGDPEVYYTGREFNFADRIRIGEGNRMNAKKSAWCALAKVTKKDLEAAIKAERQRREDEHGTEAIRHLREQADFYGFALVLQEEASIKRFTTRDQSTGEVTSTDTNLTLEAALEITNWSERAIAHIVNLLPGESIIESGIYVERTS